MEPLKTGSDLFNRLFEKQFELIGETGVTYEMVQGGVRKGPRTVEWWKHYHFDNDEQYRQWRDWAYRELVAADRFDNPERVLNYMDLAFGLPVKIKKEGELF